MYEKIPFRWRLSRVSVKAMTLLLIILMLLASTPDLTLGMKIVLIFLATPPFLTIVHGIYRAGKEYKTLFPEVAEAGHHPEKTKEVEGDEWET